jgi:hypothetical protein
MQGRETKDPRPGVALAEHRLTDSTLGSILPGANRDWAAVLWAPWWSVSWRFPFCLQSRHMGKFDCQFSPAHNIHLTAPQCNPQNRLGTAHSIQRAGPSDVVRISPPFIGGDKNTASPSPPSFRSPAALVSLSLGSAQAEASVIRRSRVGPHARRALASMCSDESRRYTTANFRLDIPTDVW